MYSLMNVNCSVWSKIINVKVSPNIGIKYSRFITGTEGVVGVHVCWKHCYHDVIFNVITHGTSLLGMSLYSFNVFSVELQ